MIMSNEFIEQVIVPALQEVIDPMSGQPLLALDAISDIRVDHRVVNIVLTLGYPGPEVQQALSESIWSALEPLEEVDSVNVEAQWVAPHSVHVDPESLLSRVKNIIAVASGKGGVGKSTTTVNLALALAQLGAKVGVLDADIYGPSQATMLGIGVKRPEIRDQKAMIPHQSYGVYSISMGYLLNEQTPVAWRGPMATGALQQLMFQTDWGELDYLLVDMPPGTGDIQLTLSQKVPVTGSVIVTTPQDIALLDAKKAIEMFNKVDIPVLGVVENMAMHECSQCGHVEHIFGAGGGQRIADQYGSDFLGSLPLALSVREDADSGKPTVVAEPNGNIAQQYREIAQKAMAILWKNSLLQGMPDIVVSDD